MANPKQGALRKRNDNYRKIPGTPVLLCSTGVLFLVIDFDYIYNIYLPLLKN